MARAVPNGGWARAVRSGCGGWVRPGEREMAAADGGYHTRGPGSGADSPPLLSLRRRSKHQGPEEAVRGRGFEGGAPRDSLGAGLGCGGRG